MSLEHEKIRLILPIYHRSIMNGSSDLHRSILVGNGDDGFVVQVDSQAFVSSVDVQVQNTHFRTEWLSWRELGRKAMIAAISDLTAMGAKAHSALSSLILPKNFSDRDLIQFAKGQSDICVQNTCYILGGNLSQGSEFSATTTVFGTTNRAITRSGAAPGDLISLQGVPGASAFGLHFLLHPDKEVGEVGEVVKRAIRRWKRPISRAKHALWISHHASACIDISDGLSSELDHISRQSGVRIELKGEKLRKLVYEQWWAQEAQKRGLDPLQFFLHGGEGYELLICHSHSRDQAASTHRFEAPPHDLSPIKLHTIGQISYVRENVGVFVDGIPLNPSGHQHFSTEK